ncbi:MAG: S9 family peptidase [Firmicutes bacterium]|nr:S9 family peptidase [Bacillota bacterium]
MVDEQRFSRIAVERYMHMRSAWGPTFSHDDESVFFLCNLSGTPQVWRLDPRAPWPRQVSFFTERVTMVSASPTQDLLLVACDTGGNERTQLLIMDGEGLSVRSLTNDPAHIYQFGGWSHDGQQICYASNRRDGVHFDVFVCHVATGEHRCVHESDATNYAQGFTPDDHNIIVSRHHASLSNDLYVVDLTTGDARCFTPHTGAARFSMARFAPDLRAVYMVSDTEGEFTRLLTLRQSTGEALHDGAGLPDRLIGFTREWLTADNWDVTSLSLRQDGSALAYVTNEEGTSQLYVLELGNEEPSRAPALHVSSLPAGTFGVKWNRTGSVLALTISAACHGTDVWFYDVARGELTRKTYAAISSVPAETFVAPELVHFPSFDGRSIPGLYYKPRHNAGPWPVIVDVHGGPEGQSTNSFAGLTQYFVNNGFAVFKPNVRGSSGYGLSYLHLDDVRKRMDSVADLAHAVAWLKEHGDAKAGAIAVMGGSYGGFMVLAALTHYPDLFAAGVDIVGIANLRTFMNNTSAYRRHLRESEYGTVVDDGDFFDEISPIFRVDAITAPLFVVHGANDPRVPISEAEQMVAALRARAHPVEYLRFEDEGHGVAKLENRILTYTKIAAFLQDVLRDR